jgi:hypothetical protein
MESIKIKNVELLLNQSIQISPNGREIRYSGIRKNGQVPDKWVNGTLKSHWIYSFIYLDTGEIIEFEFDYFDKFICVLKK